MGVKDFRRCYGTLFLWRDSISLRLLCRSWRALPTRQIPIESLEVRRLLSTTAINPNDAVPFQEITIDSNPPESPVMKILGDLTNSGKEDAIVGHETNFGPGGLDWYEFPASGNPNDPWVEHVIDPTADVYESAAVADIDGKGYNDIVVAERGTIVLYQNPLETGGDVDGTWPKIVIGSDPVSNGASGHEMYLADIDGDGLTDVVTSDAIYFQNSPTSWTEVANPTFNRTEKGTALFDSGSGLGAVDIAGTGNAEDEFAIGWYENPRDTGGNARTDPWVFHAIGPAYSGYQAGDGISYATMDVNGDGRQDIVTCFGEGSTFLPGGLIWWGAPADRINGAWTENTIDASVEYVHNIRVADINGDGTPDLVVFEQDQSDQERLMVIYNEGGTGQNWLEQTLATTGGQNEWVGDITGDGDLDILNSRHGVNDGVAPIEVFMNQLSADGIVAPMITAAPTSQTVDPGQSATFTVAASGTGPLTYQWELNGLDIPGATDSSYTLDDVNTSQNGGVYNCVVGNPHGLIPSAGATLLVSGSNGPGPVVVAGANQTVSLPNNTVPLNGTVGETSLPDGGSLGSLWSQISGPGSTAFADPTNPSTTAVFSAAGTYLLQLETTDGANTNASQITVTVNPLPSITGSLVSALNGSGIPGSVVYIDSNQDGQLDDGEVSTTTDASGNFAFNDLPPGNYPISQVLPAGATSADPSGNFRDVTVTAGQNVNGVNFADLPAPAASGPALAASFVQKLPSSAVDGGSGVAKVKITNVGAAIAAGPETLTLLASVTGNFSASNVVVTTASLGTLNLKPHSSKIETIKFDYPATLIGDTYNLVAVPDSSNSVPQSGFNSGLSNAVVIAPPFVQLDASLPGNPPKSLASGKSSAVSVRIDNDGDETSAAQLSITLYEASDTDLDEGGVLLGTLAVKKIRITPGGHAIYRVAFKTPSDIIAGDEYIVADISGGSAAESLATVNFS